jgi:hypothetical protein
MNKKASYLLLLIMFIGVFAIAGCKRTLTEDQIKAYEQGLVSPEAESKEIKELKVQAGIPENARMLNVSRYGSETPRVVEYGEMKAWRNYKGETGAQIGDKKIKLLNEAGEVIGEDKLSKIAKDSGGNVSAYIASSPTTNEQNRIVIINEKGDVEKDIKLVQREEKKEEKSILKEHQVGYLSEDGNYIGAFYVKYWTEDKDVGKLGADLPNALYRFQYMDKKGHVLWEVTGDRNNPISDNTIKISKDGSRVILTGNDYEKEKEDKDSNYLSLYDRNGQLIVKYYYFAVTEIQLTKDGRSAIFTIDALKNGEIITKYIILSLGDGNLNQTNAQNWNEFNDRL